VSSAVATQGAAETGEAFFHAAQAALGVQDRFQFFVWMHLHLHRFVPHDLVLFYIQRGVLADPTARAFHSVPVGARVLELVSKAPSPFWCALIERWHRSSCKPVAILLDGSLPFDEVAGLQAAGFDALLVHGAEGRQRSNEETIFAFGRRQAGGRETGPAAKALPSAAVCHNLALWLPYLHFTAIRALATREADIPADPTPADPHLVRSRTRAVAEAGAGRATLLTARELQVLEAVRAATARSAWRWASARLPSRTTFARSCKSSVRATVPMRWPRPCRAASLHDSANRRMSLSARF
jgi:hypothetical protein